MPIDNMKIRLGYLGGNSQIERMNKDKLRSLKSSFIFVSGGDRDSL